VDEIESRTPENLEAFFNEQINVSIRFLENGYLDTGKRAAFVVALYKNEKNILIGAIAMDYLVAVSGAAAMANLPYDVVEQAAENEDITGRVYELMKNFFSSCAKVVSPDAVYHRFYEYPKNLPDAFYELLVSTHEEMSADSDHSDLFATVRTYGEGQLVFFDDIFEGRRINDSFWYQETNAEEEEVAFEDDPDLNYEEMTWDDIDTGPAIPKGWFFAFVLILLAVGGGWWFMIRERPPPPKKPLPPIIAVEQSLLKGGVFTMGCTEDSKECSLDEKSHTVKMSRSFYIMVSEVTQELYRRVTSKTPSEFWKCGNDCPVENVSWLEAAKFANLLSKNHRLEACYIIEGSNVMWPQKQNCEGWRLPTEAEWEFAARGESKKFRYAGSDDLESVSWFDLNTEVKREDGEHGWYGKVPHLDNMEKTTVKPICQKKKNEHGLCDMSGNVWEWTWDIYGSEFYTRLAAKKNPIGTMVGNHRVIRGGSWGDLEQHNRVYHRSAIPEWATTGMDKAKKKGKLSIIQSGSVGLRLVRTAVVR